jgi:hypothetical protein
MKRKQRKRRRRAAALGAGLLAFAAARGLPMFRRYQRVGRERLESEDLAAGSSSLPGKGEEQF